jgi:hypothetical protein
VATGDVHVRLGNGDGTFAPAQHSPGDGATRQGELADLNGDGRLDLVAANASGVLVLVGNGDGSFQTPRPPLSLPPINGQAQALGSVLLGDLNEDGRTDLVVGGSIYQLTWYGSLAVIHYANLFLGDGNGGFQHTRLLNTVGSASQLADCNGDGRPDLLTGTGPFLYRGNGDGSFQAPSIAAYGMSRVHAVADLNGDDRVDLVGTNGSAQESVAVALGNGDGTFQPLTTYQGSAARPNLSVALGDFNGDDKVDLVTTSSSGADVSVLLGNGDGSFQSPQFSPAGPAGRPAVGDLDGNGFLDVVAGSLLFNDGDWAAGEPPPPPVLLSISDAGVVEGDVGTTDAVFTVTLSRPADQPVSVGLQTFNGTATAGSDYAPVNPLIPLTFDPGETSKTVRVAILGDAAFEPDETFQVLLRNPVGATISDGTGVGTILNDDDAPPPPTLTISDVSKKEGRKGTISFTFTVTLSAPSAVPVTVNYATADGSATVSDGDYVATSGTLTFAAGQTSKTITISVKGDRKKEANETFLVNLLSASNALIADGQEVGTIRNDD